MTHVVKTDSRDPVKPGQTVDYRLAVVNHGPSDATGVSLNDTIPAQTSYFSANATQGTYAVPFWTVGNLASGVSANLTLVVAVSGNATGILSNTATVSNVASTMPQRIHDQKRRDSRAFDRS